MPPPVTDLNIQLVAGAPTRTVEWAAGWQNGSWTGATSAPAEAFSCADGKYAAVYQFVGGGLERYFPGRPDISNLTDLAQYDAFLILITEAVSCDVPVEAAPGATRTVAVGARAGSTTPGPAPTAPRRKPPSPAPAPTWRRCTSSRREAHWSATSRAGPTSPT